MKKNLSDVVSEIVADLKYNPQIKAQTISWLDNITVIMDTIGEEIEEWKFVKRTNEIRFKIAGKKFAYKIFGGVIEAC